MTKDTNIHTLERIRSIIQHLGMPAAWGEVEYLPKDKEKSNTHIYDLLTGDAPCMIARMGYFELGVVANYLSITRGRSAILPYLLGKSSPWWWDRKLCAQIGNNAGFFPVTTPYIERYCELMLEDMALIDLLGSWLKHENEIPQLQSTPKVGLHDLEPFFASKPWTHALSGKNVVVVHPFEHSICNQHAQLPLVFPDGMMPQFNLKTIKAVQTIAGEQTAFKDWFEALDYMKSEMDATVYDICIIGAGAYGLPLAAHAKRMGKKAFHLGGVTQMLFGIKGKRWDESNIWPYQQLYNEHWVRPAQTELPRRASKVEGACYW